MAVSNAIFEHVPARVPTRGERAMLKIERQRGLSLSVRPLDAHLPRTVRGRAIGAQVAAEIDEERCRVARRQQLVSAVHRILFADAAEVQFHPLGQQ